MHARTTVACIAALLAYSCPALADDAMRTVRAELAPSGDPIKLVVTSGGKKPSAKLAIGKGAPVSLHDGEAAGTLKTGHGRTVIALAIDDAKAPFRIHVVDGAKPGAALSIKRPAKRHDFPYAVVMTATPSGFAVFFQEIELQNTNEAHTYLVELDKDGKPAGDAREVQVPWALGDAAWNGKGYHLALYFNGMRLSMVSLDQTGRPEQHPDWASGAGVISDAHLHVQDGKIRAFFRGGAAGDRLLEADVTQIRQWGTEPPKAKDHGTLGATATFAVTAKGQPKKLDAK